MTSLYWFGRYGPRSKSATDQIKLTFSPTAVIAAGLLFGRDWLSGESDVRDAAEPPTAAEILVSDVADGNQRMPDLAHLGDGRVAAVWDSDHPGAVKKDVFMRMLDGDGALLDDNRRAHVVLFDEASFATVSGTLLRDPDPGPAKNLGMGFYVTDGAAAEVSYTLVTGSTAAAVVVTGSGGASLALESSAILVVNPGHRRRGRDRAARLQAAFRRG